MAEFTLKPMEVDTLRLNIGDKTFQIPLANSLTLEEATMTGTPAGTILFLQKYIKDKELLEQLRVGEYNAIIAAWKDASAKAAGITPGES